MAAFEPIGVDMYNQSISSEIAKTLNCAATDADHVPCVIEVIPIEGNGSRPSHKGDGYNEGGQMYTLNSTEVHGVAYALQIRGGREVDSHGNKAGKGPLIKEDVMPCLDTTTPGTVTVFQPVVLESNQNHATVTQNGICPTLPASMGMGGGYVPMITEPAVCYAVDMGGGKSSSMISEELSPTLCTTHQGEPAVCYGLDRASYNQGQNALFDFSVLEEQQPTLTAKGPGGWRTCLYQKTVGALCATDYKWVQNQQVTDGKLICLIKR